MRSVPVHVTSDKSHNTFDRKSNEYFHLDNFGVRFFSNGNDRFELNGIDFGRSSLVTVDLDAGVQLNPRLKHDSDYLVVAIVDAGSLSSSSSAFPSFEVKAGSFWLYDSTTNFQMITQFESTLLFIRIPSQVLRDFAVDEKYEHIRIRSLPGLAAPSIAFFKSSSSLNAPLTSLSTYFIEKLMHEMIGGIVLDSHGAHFSPSRKNLYNQAMAYIAATAGNPDTTPGGISSELSVSLRQLQREFKSNGQSIAATLRSHRADLALRQLGNSGLSVLSLEEIATHSGFTSSSQMRRALRQSHNVSPNDVRLMRNENS